MQRRAVIADADRSLRDSYARALNRAGYEVAVAADGPGCVGLLRHFRPNVLVLDLDLLWAGGDGILSCWPADAPLPSAPALVLSGRPEGQRLYRLLRLVSFPRGEYRDKPLKPGAMAECVGRLVAQACPGAMAR